MQSTTWWRSLAQLVVPVLPLALLVGLAPASSAEETGCYAVAGNVVQNCGFEDGSAWPWTITVNGGFTYVTDVDWSGYPAHSGTHFVQSHSSPGSVVEQTFDTVSGVTYEVGFYLRGGDYWESSFYLNVDADASGPAEAQTLLTRANLPAVPLPDYTLLTTQFVAQGPSATLSFILVLLPNYWWLDDVSVVPLTSPQTITVTTPAPSTASYGESFDVAATAGSGLAVDVTTSGGCSIDGATVTMTSGTTDCVVHFNQAGDATYAAAPEVTNTVTAEKALQSISFAPLAARTLDDPPVTVAATASSGLPVTFGTTTPSVCTSSGDQGSTITLVAVGTCSVTADQTGSDDYAPADQVSQSFTVGPGKLDQTITVTVAPPPSATVGSTFRVAAVASSGLPVETTVAGGCTLDRRTVTVTGAGSDCSVRFDQAGNATYDAAPQVTYVVTTAKSTQTITFRALADRRLAQSPVTLKATASSRLPVSFTSLTPSVCTTGGAYGATLALVATGTCTVVADQSGSLAYAPAPGVTRSFTVKP